jgi:predicted nuclease of predicted toxin-antitoxin system
MTIWVDAQLSPRLARWIADNVQVEAMPLRDLRNR